MGMLISLLILIIVFGVIFWLVQNAIPMTPPFQKAATAVLAIIFILYLLGSLHAGHPLWVNSESWKM